MKIEKIIFSQNSNKSNQYYLILIFGEISYRHKKKVIF